MDEIVAVRLPASTWEKIIRVLLEIDPPSDPLLYVALQDALTAALPVPYQYEIYADGTRHLVTVPYDRKTMIAAAKALGIGGHWYHPDARHAHVDIPVRMLTQVLDDPRVTVLSAREILAITKGELTP